MDISRSILDNLMGRDRNLPKNSTQIRDHYSNSDVCKPYLICFCFNTLFPNTIYDEGPCNKRHDTYLKTMFDSDTGRSEHEKVYLKDCISWIQRRLQEVEQKTKKNLSTIENKTSITTERPRQILDRLLSIDKDIENMMNQAAIFGQNGQIDDSARCLEEVERLRQHRKEVDLMGDNLLAVVKHQKICEICGAIQTINDTEKRIQMHLEGKIHQGFLKLRTQIETLKIRYEIVQQKIDKERQKNRSNAITQGQYQAPEPKVERVQRIEEKPEQKQKQHHKEKQRQKEKEKPERESPKKKKKQHKHKQDRASREKKKRQRSQSGDRDRLDKHERSRSRDKHRKKQKKRKEHSRERQRKSHSYERDQHRSRYYG